jgi:hypothetical protein
MPKVGTGRYVGTSCGSSQPTCMQATSVKCSHRDHIRKEKKQAENTEKFFDPKAIPINIHSLYFSRT